MHVRNLACFWSLLGYEGIAFRHNLPIHRACTLYNTFRASFVYLTELLQTSRGIIMVFIILLHKTSRGIWFILEDLECTYAVALVLIIHSWYLIVTSCGYHNLDDAETFKDDGMRCCCTKSFPCRRKSGCLLVITLDMNLWYLCSWLINGTMHNHYTCTSLYAQSSRVLLRDFTYHPNMFTAIINH